MPITLESINPTLTHLRASPNARYEAGRAHREAVPLEVHAELVAETERADPLAILAQQNKSRVPELIPLRYGRMSRTPFTFLRGDGGGHGQRSRGGGQDRPLGRTLR